MLTPRPSEPTRLLEGRSTWAGSLLGVVAIVLIAGWWGLGILAGVLFLLAGRTQLRVMAAGFGGLAGIGAALSINADESGFFALLSIASAVGLAACLVAGLDDAGARVLAGAVRKLSGGTTSGGVPFGSRVRRWAIRAWQATSLK